MIDFEKARQTIEAAEVAMGLALFAVIPERAKPIEDLLTLAKALMPQHGVRLTGVIRWYNSEKGYGFVTADNGRDAFVHKRALNDAAIETLREGERIEYTLIEMPKGLQARAIVRLR